MYIFIKLLGAAPLGIFAGGHSCSVSPLHEGLKKQLVPVLHFPDDSCSILRQFHQVCFFVAPQRPATLSNNLFEVKYEDSGGSPLGGIIWSR